MRDDQLIQLLAGQAAIGTTLAASRQLLTGLADEAQLVRVVERFQREVNGPRQLTDPAVFLDAEGLPEAWYRGPQDGEDRFWPLAVRSMRLRGLDDRAIEAVDRATTRILCLTQPPGIGSIDTRGLVLGYVQSGKTTNFTGLIAKAADAGYRFIVVLTGMTENLRVQTQQRIHDSLIEPDPDVWFETTNVLNDFSTTANAGYVLSRNDGRAIAVVKKNPHRLNRLNTWLDSAGAVHLRNCPILVIDDEADQASIDVGRDLPSRINRQIRRLLDRPKAAYIAYTATPFANLLIDPTNDDDLYPRHFVVDLPHPGAGYLGTREVFGRHELETDDDGGLENLDGLDMIRQIPDAEADEVRPPRNRDLRATWEPAVPSSMEEAVRWFLLATAARRVRSGRVEHSSMLIHTTLYTDVQLAFRPEIEQLIGSLVTRLEAKDASLLAELRSQWDAERNRVDAAEFALERLGFADINDKLVETARATTVWVDNYRSDTRIVYRGDEPLTAIVIGGNTLSRGLTLEGLVSSYFVRASRAYDTLLQMGRWFGFRTGWQDLPRIWMTGELWNWFTWLATVEEEIRRDIRRYEAERLSPLEFAARIRLHPDLAITSALKMRDAVPAHVSFARSRQQTILFNHRDREWLNRNLEAARAFLTRAAATSAQSTTPDGRVLLADVPASEIIDFFSNYQFHQEAMHLRSSSVCDYIRRQNEAGQLGKWNVVVAGVQVPAGQSGLELGLEHPVGRIVRSRLDIEGLQYANIKSLMSQRDWLADLPDHYPPSDADFWRVREEHAPGRGLLVLYPIEARSEPERRAGRTPRIPRANLDAVEDVIGVGVIFPPTAATLDIDYVAAALPIGNIDEPDDLDEMTEDAADN